MIDAPIMTLDRERAAELYKQYRVHAAYEKPVDAEIASALYQISKGRKVIMALDAVVKAELGADGFPLLAIGPADVSQIFGTIYTDGSCHMMSSRRAPSLRRGHVTNRQFSFPSGSFTGVTRYRDGTAQTPYIPPMHRPKRGLANYTLLWQAEWTPTPPRDPLLLRRIGRGDLWLVLAAWDLTPIEAAVLAGRSGAAR